MIFCYLNFFVLKTSMHTVQIQLETQNTQNLISHKILTSNVLLLLNLVYLPISFKNIITIFETLIHRKFNQFKKNFSTSNSIKMVISKFEKYFLNVFLTKREACLVIHYIKKNCTKILSIQNELWPHVDFLLNLLTV